jgi:hypothetical protein
MSQIPGVIQSSQSETGARPQQMSYLTSSPGPQPRPPILTVISALDRLVVSVITATLEGALSNPAPFFHARRFWPRETSLPKRRLLCHLVPIILRARILFYAFILALVLVLRFASALLTLTNKLTLHMPSPHTPFLLNRHTTLIAQAPLDQFGARGVIKGELGVEVLHGIVVLPFDCVVFAGRECRRA